MSNSTAMISDTETISAIRAIPRASLIEIAGFAAGGWMVGRGLLVEPIVISAFLSLSPGMFLSGAAALLGSAAVVVRNQLILDRALSASVAMPLRKMHAWEADARLIAVGRGEFARTRPSDEFGISDDRVILFASRVSSDRVFATSHYSDVRPGGRVDYEKFRAVFARRHFAFVGRHERWYPTERGIRFAVGLAEQKGN